MTFSDTRVVELLQTGFVPVWESAAPVRVVTFDLGEGRSVKGTVSGEIALYFCTPEGKVFDVLPALQSPAATLQAMQEALAFYKKHDGRLTAQVVRDFHRQRMERVAGARIDVQAGNFGVLDRHRVSQQGVEARQKAINEAVDAATRDLRLMAFSKTTVAQPQHILVVEPGGRGYYRWEVDKRFVALETWVEQWEPHFVTELKAPLNPSVPPLKTPGQWKNELFTHILQQPLTGGEVTYNSDSLKAIRIIEDFK